jgi:hypothetical protein
MKPSPYSAYRVAYRHFNAMSMVDAYKLLGISPGATPEEVLKAYKRKALENHPDRGGSDEDLRLINVAKDTIDGKVNESGRTNRNPSPPSSSSPGDYDYTPPPVDRGPPPPKVEVSFKEAWSEAGIPANVTWVFRTNTGRGRNMGDSEYLGMVLYGHTDTQHIFVGLHHFRHQNAFTREDHDVWTVTSTRSSFDNDLGKLALKEIQRHFKSFEGLDKGFNSKVIFLTMATDVPSSYFDFTRGERREVSLKDALAQLDGKSTTEDTGRKLTVSMEFKSDPSDRPDDYNPLGFSFVINGKVFKLSLESNIFIEKKTRVVPTVFGQYTYNEGKKDLMRSKAGKKVLTFLAEKLTNEPQELRDLLARAAAQLK